MLVQFQPHHIQHLSIEGQSSLYPLNVNLVSIHSRSVQSIHTQGQSSLFTRKVSLITTYSRSVQSLHTQGQFSLYTLKVSLHNQGQSNLYVLKVSLVSTQSRLFHTTQSSLESPPAGLAFWVSETSQPPGHNTFIYHPSHSILALPLCQIYGYVRNQSDSITRIDTKLTVHQLVVVCLLLFFLFLFFGGVVFFVCFFGGLFWGVTLTTSDMNSPTCLIVFITNTRVLSFNHTYENNDISISKLKYYNKNGIDSTR